MDAPIYITLQFLFLRSICFAMNRSLQLLLFAIICAVPNAENVQIDSIFRDKPGQTVELFWQNGKDAISNGLMEHSHQKTIKTYPVHRFYVKPKGSDTILQESIIEEETSRITNMHKEREKWQVAKINCAIWVTLYTVPRKFEWD